MPRFAIVEAELDAVAAARLRAYEKEVDLLVRRGLRIKKADLRRIRSSFNSFRSRALAAIPERYLMNQAAIVGTLDSVAKEIDRLGAELGSIVKGGLVAEAETVQKIGELYGDRFLPLGAQAPILGMTPQALDLASRYSADLIGLRTGGLGARILKKVNDVLRLSALGAGPGAFNAAADINAALGGARAWSWQAERIYRTEVLRVNSLLTEQTIQTYNDAGIKTRKRWKWSGIDRKEHKAIDGQERANKRRFDVPLRDGGSAKMRYPRDPSAPASATINCGCYVIPVPADARRSDEPTARTRPRPKKRTAPKKKPAPKTPKAPTGPTPFDRSKLPENPMDALRVVEREIKSKLATEGMTRPTDVAARARDWGTPASISRRTDLGAHALEAWEDLQARFPKLRGLKIERFDVAENLGPSGRSPSGLCAVAKDASKTRMGVASYVGDEAHMLNWGDRALDFADIHGYRSHVFTATTREEFARNFPKDIFRHEYGHAFDNELKLGFRFGDQKWGTFKSSTYAKRWGELVDEMGYWKAEEIVSKFDDAGKMLSGLSDAEKNLLNAHLRSNQAALAKVKKQGLAGWADVSDAAKVRLRNHWLQEVVSEYSTTNVKEAFAELFAMVTDQGYKSGTLPKALEEFFEEILGASLG